MDFGNLATGIAGGLNTAYNLYANKRDFDYQKALQQTIFEREDTAVQRRMADLQDAGLNPNLAAGSAANAGAVVSRSNTNDVNMGSALDMIQAVNTIRQQKQQVENAKVENEILNQEASMKSIEHTLSKAQLFNQLGLNYGIVPSVQNGKLDLNFRFNSGQGQLKEDMPLFNAFNVFC